jgi:hypothetical protein
MPERPSDCAGANADSDYCQGRLLTLWNATEVDGNDARTYYPEGFCAIADVLGEDTSQPPGPMNPLDGVPEVIVVADGHVLILQGTDSGAVDGGTILEDVAIPGGEVQGGAPNVDDFDGDGFPEIGTALATRYAVVDLQAPDADNCPAWVEPIAAEVPPPGENPARTPGGSGASGSCTRTRRELRLPSQRLDAGDGGQLEPRDFVQRLRLQRRRCGRGRLQRRVLLPRVRRSLRRNTPADPLAQPHDHGEPGRRRRRQRR